MADIREKLAALQRDLNDLTLGLPRLRDEAKLEGMKLVEDKLGPIIVDLQKSNYSFSKQLKTLQEQNQYLSNQVNQLLKDKDFLQNNSTNVQKAFEKYKASVKQEVDSLNRDKSKNLEILYSCMTYKLTNLYTNRPNVDADLLRQSDLELRSAVRRLEDSITQHLNRFRNLNGSF